VAAGQPDPYLLPQAITFGCVGAALGAVVYASFIAVTHIEIGFLSVAVAYLVAKSVLFGSNNTGGRLYQISAVVLTFGSISLGEAGWLWWTLRKIRPIPLTPHNVVAFWAHGVMEPFFEFQHSPGGTFVGFIILFVGLRAAWRMTSSNPSAARSPFGRPERTVVVPKVGADEREFDPNRPHRADPRVVYDRDGATRRL
jgi:hypothetical protein